MTQVNKKGMSFCQKTGSRARKGNWLIQTMDVLVMFLAVVIPAVYTMGLWQSDILLPIMVAGIYICVMFAILAKFEKQNWYSVLVLVLIFIVVLIGRNLFIEGMADIWNKIGDSWTAATGIVVQDIATGTVSKQSSAGYLLFGAVAGAVLALTSCFVSSYLSFVAGMMLPALLLVETIAFDITVPLWIWVLIMVSALYLMISGIWKNSKSAGAILSSCFSCIITASVIFTVMLICKTDNRLTVMSGEIKADIHQKIYETQYTTLPEGKLHNYRDKSKTAQTALVVSMEEPEQMYLKGFSGSVYENGIWTALDTKLIAENEEMLYWFNTNGFNPKTQFAAAQIADFQKNTVTVQNISACSEYLYAPFSIVDGDYIKDEDINPDSIKGENKRIYTYSVVSGGADSITATIEKLQKSNAAEVLEYRKNESAYRNFVYENYLQVPQEAVEILGEQWDITAEKYNSADNLTLAQAQEVTLQFLSRCFTEDGKVEKIELPLKSAENTSYQFSTVAALTLRYFGIPARYAEGYVISAEMAQKAENGTTIKVDSNCARAWVEVYQEGIGWIPMDLTPGFGEFTEEKITESDTKGQSTEGTEETEDEENPEDKEDQPDYTGGYMVRVMKKVKKGVSVLLVAIILSALMVYIRRKIILTKKYSLFETDNVNDSTARIYTDVADILKAMGYDRGNGSMAALYDDFYYSYGKDYADKFMAATAINSRAIFSSKKLDENHRKQIYEFREYTLEIMKNNVKWAKRQWIKWGLCLY